MNFLQNIWTILWYAPRGERFLLIVMSIFAALDLLSGNLIYAAIEAAVVVACITLSYRDMLWFADNEDEVRLEDVVETILENPHVAAVIGSRVIQVASASDELLDPERLMTDAADSVRRDIIDGR